MPLELPQAFCDRLLELLFFRLKHGEDALLVGKLLIDAAEHLPHLLCGIGKKIGMDVVLDLVGQGAAHKAS